MNVPSLSLSPAELEADRLSEENRVLREKLTVAEDTIAAIRGGLVDAVVVDRDRDDPPEIWTLEAADRWHLRLALQEAHAGTWDWDLSANRMTWSESMWPLLGLDRDAASETMEALQERMHPEDRAAASRQFLLAGSSRAEYYDEFRILTPDRGVRWLAGRGRALHSMNGDFEHLVGIFVDITERKLAEEALRSADRRKDEFLAMLGHELRNPLGVITSTLRLTRKDELKEGDWHWARDILERQTENLTHLIDDLLDVSRIREGKIELKVKRVSLSDVVKRTAENLRALFRNANHNFVVVCPDSIFVQADATRLEQMIWNLLTNAAKYTHPGGSVQLSVSAGAGTAEVIVKDSGIGISPQMLPRIFDLFAQADEGIDRSRGGLGIGLSLVKRLAEMHGGTIEAKSDGKGCGSEFILRLPICHAIGAAPSAAAAVSKAPRSRKVLVVDDNEDAALTLAMLLESSGHKTAVAHSGEHALELAKTFEPEAALLDIGLPEMDGYELAARIRKSGLKLFLVAVSGYGQAEDRARSKDAGFDLHLLKPVDHYDIIQLLEERL